MLYQHPQRYQHPGGVWEEAIALAENFDRRFNRAMQQQLGAPVEEIGLAGVEFGRFLIFAHGCERITGFFRDVAPQVMLPGLFLKSRTRLGRSAGRTRRWRRSGDRRLLCRSAQSRDILGQRFPGSDYRIRTVPAEIGAVGDAGHGELRFVEKFWRILRPIWPGPHSARAGLRSFEHQVNSLRFLRSDHAWADCGLAVSRLFYAQDINSFAQPGEVIAPGCVRASR